LQTYRTKRKNKRSYELAWGCGVRETLHSNLKYQIAYLARIWLGGHMDSKMRGDMIALAKGADGAPVPFAGQAQVVLSLTADMLVPQMLVEGLCVIKVLEAGVPLTDIIVREDERVWRRNAFHVCCLVVGLGGWRWWLVVVVVVCVGVGWSADVRFGRMTFQRMLSQVSERREWQEMR
jgi:hypothetical protein